MAGNEIETMQQRYRALWQKLGYETPRWGIDTEFRKTGDTETILEFVDGEYRNVTIERGVTLHVQATRDPDQMLEWLAYDLVGNLARFTVDEEGIDFRDPRWHPRWIELQLNDLAKMNPEWAQRRRLELQ